MAPAAPRPLAQLQATATGTAPTSAATWWIIGVLLSLLLAAWLSGRKG